MSTYEADERVINTTYDPKPIPDRQFDWTAIENEYEPGRPIGYGATEAEAVADLLMQLGLEVETFH
jgi:hypothetical protein